VKRIVDVRLNAFVIMLFFALGFAGAISAQSRNEIGTFDIEKVRQAVSGADEKSIDTATRASALPVIKNEKIGWLILRIAFYLLIVTGAIILISWGAKRIGLTGRSKIGGNGSMDTLEVLSLGPNRAIMLVRVMDRVYLLSQTQTNITVLDKIEGDKAVDLIASTKGGVSISQFKDVFNNFMGKMKHN
jgi:flagellar biosynthetic protein FliO